MKRLLPLCLAATTGCATVSIGPQPAVRADFDPRIDVPVAKIAQAETTRIGTDDSEDDSKLHKVSPAVFWTGIIVGLVGTAALIGFGIDGRLTEAKIEKGYDEGFTRQERDDLETRGDRANTLAGVSAGLGVAGFSMAVIMAGIDYSRCGPLSKRRKCERESED